MSRLKEFWRTWRGWLILGLALLAALIVFVVLAWTGIVETGFGDYTSPRGEFQRGKTLWDWMDLLLVPVLLALGAAWLNRATGKRERKLELDRSREAALQSYLDVMTDLLKDNLRQSDEGDVKREIARSRTLAVLRQLDGPRRTLILEFLYNGSLLGEWETSEDGVHRRRKPRIVDLARADLREIVLSRTSLHGADLRETDLRGSVLSETSFAGAYLFEADLRDADLSDGVGFVGADLTEAQMQRANMRGTELTGANLSFASLRGADLRWADLSGANLDGADLTGANLSEAKLHKANLATANLSGAKVSREQLDLAESLKGATLPDGTVHE